MNPVISKIHAANYRFYKTDRGHPCANFCFDVLREVNPEKYKAIADQIKTLEWGQSCNQRGIAHRSKMFSKYISLFGFRPVKTPKDYDLCFMAETGGSEVYHCGLYLEGKIIHLHTKSRELCADAPDDVNIVLFGRK